MQADLHITITIPSLARIGAVALAAAAAWLAARRYAGRHAAPKRAARRRSGVISIASTPSDTPRNLHRDATWTRIDALIASVAA